MKKTLSTIFLGWYLIIGWQPAEDEVYGPDSYQTRPQFVRMDTENDCESAKAYILSRAKIPGTARDYAYWHLSAIAFIECRQF
jgi:hypothetical protein